jgi:hypothetical protein
MEMSMKSDLMVKRGSAARFLAYDAKAMKIIDDIKER